MKKIYMLNHAFRHYRFSFLSLYLLAGLCLLQLSTAAQNPNLPSRATLSQTLLTNKTFTNGTAVDTVVRQRPIANEFTLQVVAKVNAASGRGLDIEARNAGLKGFRLSLDAANLKATYPLTTPRTLSASNAGEEHVIRVAVKNDSAHIYQNGAYLLSQPVSQIKDIAAGVETDQLSDTVTGPNIVSNWAGTPPNNTGMPSAYGWVLSGTTSTTLFANANSTTPGTSRYMDVNASSGGNLHTLNGSTYIGRLLYVRWDAGNISSASYCYPVTLEANTTYNFSILYAYISNAAPGTSITVGIGKTTATADRYDTRQFTTSGTRSLKRESFYFTSREAGVYYLTFTGPWGLFSIGELDLKKLVTTPRFIFGKNYPSGAVNMEISSATYEDGAWAPAALVTRPRQTVMLTGALAQVPTTFNTDFIVPSKTDVHFNAEYTPYVNSSIALNSNDAWLFFDNLKPSDVIAGWLNSITINGAAAVNNTNVRIAVYKNGTAVIPNGNLTNAAALQVFTQPNLGGTSQTYAIQTIHNNLGAFNNSIRSFKLKRGYMATLANNPDGTGYSRVFIANDSDVVVNAMPTGLDTTISFIRVLKWNWPSKKGKAGWDPGKVNATWYYDWNIAGNSTSPNYDYSAIRQTQFWPNYSDIINKPNVNHILGFNEPDRPDQANMSVDASIAQWPELMKTGLRIGSPSPSDPFNGWLPPFLRKADSLNYRVDYVAIHCYWGGFTPQQWYDRLLNVYNTMGRRPLWITEWNNGANWTTETWPADFASQQQKQLNDLKGILQVLDTASFIERYAEYDWVENKRALVLNDTLTPAGKYYATNKSDFAYNPAKEFIHNWRLVAPRLAGTISDTNYYRVAVNWADMNGELGSKYILERKIDGRDTGFIAVQSYTAYTIGSTMNFMDSVYGKASYRVRAFGRDTTITVLSAVLDIIRDVPPVAPTALTGTVISSSRLQVNWNAGTNVRSYNLKRSLSASGPWTTILSRTTSLTYLDTALTPATTYYYVVTTLNSAGESPNSTVLALTTPALVTPTGVQNLRVASGDSRAVLTWNFQYDAKYKVLRSMTSAGTYDTIATNVEALRYVDSGRTNNTTYYYKMIAFNAAGSSPVTATFTATPKPGQHLYISFDDTTSMFAEDFWGGYHASLATSALHDTGYLSSGAVRFNGTANSFATLGADPLTNLNNFTVSVWVKMSALTNWMRIFDFGTGTNKYMFLTPQVSATGGLSTVRYAIKNGGAEQTLSYPYAWSLNTWTHLAITQSGDTVRMYINGALVATNNAITIHPADLGITNLNYIGKSQFADPILNGAVDELKIFNYALSGQNIANLFGGLPLPIKLVTFEGKATTGGNLLSWKVTTNSDVIRMELERSTDSRSFSTIHSIAATRTSTTQPFSFTDAQANAAVNYYRLKMIDQDGKVTYSPVIALSKAAKGMEVIGLYPSVVNNSAYLSISSAKATSIKTVITDLYGRTIQSATKMLVAGSNLLPVDVSRMAAGTYNITVYDGETRAGNIRFVVSR